MIFVCVILHTRLKDICVCVILYGRFRDTVKRNAGLNRSRSCYTEKFSFGFGDPEK